MGPNGGWARDAARRLIVGAVAVAGVCALAPAMAAAKPPVRAECPAPSDPHVYRCFALVRTDRAPMSERRARAKGDAIPAGFGYTPDDLQSAYNLASAAASDGGGATVAIIDAYDDPSADADLTTYRTAAGLPACTIGDGCFKQLNQEGQTAPLPEKADTLGDNNSSGWDGEESLDVDMVSAICPNCKIDLIEADSSSSDDLDDAADTGASLAGYESNSYGGGEYPGEAAEEDSFFDHPGKVITASAGDDGFGVSYPASSPYVVAVGGTNLQKTATPRGWTETVWGTDADNGTGSGCSAYEPKPSWQIDGLGCTKRTVADVAADADPDTGVAVYDSYDGAGGWQQVGGTSASSPMIAAVYALAGTPSAGSYPSWYPYAHRSELYDVNSGTDDFLGECTEAYLCTGEVGYDGPTGLGTPDGIGAFQAAAKPAYKSPTATISSPASGQTFAVGQAVPTSFTCAEGAAGPGLASCDDSVGAVTTTGGTGTLNTTAPGTHTYTVRATSHDGRSATASITYSVGAKSAPAAGVSVKLSGARRAAAGSKFVETLTVANAGPSTATRLRSSMSIPAAVTVKQAGGGTRRGGALHWSAPSLAAGAKMRYRVTFKVGAHADQRVSIHGSASGAVADPDSSDNAAKATVQLHPVKHKHKHKKHHHHKHGGGSGPQHG